MTSYTGVRIHRFGGPEVLTFDDLPMPEPKDDEVLLKVHAASVNPVDIKIRSGSYPLVQQEQLPIVIGRDVSGVIERCGPGAPASLRPGTAIYAMVDWGRGSHAEYVLVKPGEAAAKPSRLDHLQAASVPLAGLTAWQGLFDHGGLKAGQRVLIHGGAGGVGHFAIQFAKAAGATVITTVSGNDLSFARELGADQAIDYQRERFESLVQPVDLVFDLVAGETQDRSWSILKTGGTLISTLREPSPEEARQHKAKAARYMAKPNGGQLAEIARLIDAGTVRPHITATYPLADVAMAEERLEKEHLRGKLVLEIAA